jgi:hypothetical protein
MLYHVLDFGAYSGAVEEFSDLEGYVPTQDEDWHNLTWDHAHLKAFSNPETGNSEWHDFLEKSTIAVNKTFYALEGLHTPRKKEMSGLAG